MLEPRISIALEPSRASEVTESTFLEASPSGDPVSSCKGKERIDSASRRIAATAPDIYEALTRPDLLARWLAPSGMDVFVEQFEPRIGGRYRMVLTYHDRSDEPGKSSSNADIVEGRFDELALNSRLVETVRFESSDPAFAGDMRISWNIMPAAGGTLVTVRCENVPRGISREDHERGLNSSLESLARLR